VFNFKAPYLLSRILIPSTSRSNDEHPPVKPLLVLAQTHLDLSFVTLLSFSSLSSFVFFFFFFLFFFTIFFALSPLSHRYVTTSFVGAAFVDAAKFLTCANPLKCDHMKVIQGSGTGYKDFAANQVMGESTIAYTMTGNVFGSLATAGAYLGMASVINTGDKDILTDRSSFLIANADNQKGITRDGSDDGAPFGPYNICITEDKECKTKRKFKAKGYKFSIFGYTSGTDYTATVKAGANGFPATQTHMGVRVGLMGGGGVDLSKMVINGDKTIDTIGNGNVKSISLPAPDGTTFAWTFPLK